VWKCKEAVCSFTNEGSSGTEYDQKLARTAQFALIGGGVGLVAGWLLTRNYDRDHAAPSERTDVSVLPVPTVLPVAGADGRTRAVPALGAQGRF
jgi:hypothetical protein